MIIVADAISFYDLSYSDATDTTDTLNADDPVNVSNTSKSTVITDTTNVSDDAYATDDYYSIYISDSTEASITAIKVSDSNFYSFRNYLSVVRK